jgi:hypothetical protein
MQTNVLWTGREYHSIENCLVTVDKSGADIRSTILGTWQSKIYRVEYHIKTNANWETVFAEIKSRHSNKEEQVKLESDGKGNWSRDGKKVTAFTGCIDIDIPLTPFTNTLPIKRQNLEKGKEAQINVLYIDLLEEQVRPVHQKYIRLSDTVYHYENVPNDFEADITVDDFGLVIDYPELFVRTAVQQSNYKR